MVFGKGKTKKVFGLTKLCGTYTSFNKRNQHAMKKEKNKNKKSVQSNWLEKKTRKEWGLLLLLKKKNPFTLNTWYLKHMTTYRLCLVLGKY